MKRALILNIILFSLILPTTCAIPQSAKKIDKIILDPGHGGKDPGAVGKISREKDIVLSIALKAGKYIQEMMPDVTVVYTRKTDEFIELHRRAKIANDNKADLFISIHCNANKSTTPHGAETYFMGMHKTAQNLEVAKAENAAILLEEDYSQSYEGFDPNSDEDYILLSMFQSNNIEQSLGMSSYMQQHLTGDAKREDRGVKQAGFLVLYKVAMPSILVEAGFISNAEEEKFLASDEGQEKIARAICDALKKYKSEFEEQNTIPKPVVIKEEPVNACEQHEVVFRVQFASFNKQKKPDFKKFRGIPELWMYEHDGNYKYTAGNTRIVEEALKIRDDLVKKGYNDAFVIAFVDGKRTTIDDAKKYLEKN